MIARDDVINWIGALGRTYYENQDYLTELDSPIGDADHGVNMARGFLKVEQKVPSYAHNCIQDILYDVGTTLLTTIGGSAGPLYGTFFLEASKHTFGKEVLSVPEISAMFNGGLVGIMKLGKAVCGDKTMVDSLSPAVVALITANAQKKVLSDALFCALTAAEAGLKATIPMQAYKGRASYLVERSIGYQDPGATSSYLLIKAAYDIWREAD
ncbi:MAG: dihydroxyacetone kinase subunit DhaL [Phototrophicaceae bacterium]|jgi:dihydroxyacetone kinase-like protein